MAKYFTVEINPLIPASTQVAYTAKDVLFDWTSFQIPKGAAKLISVAAVFRGIDGGVQTARDLDLYFAKSIKGVAPVTLGAVNATQTGKPILSYHLIGQTHIETTDFGNSGWDFMNMAQTGGGAAASNIPMCVLEGEPASGTNVGCDTIYVGGNAGGALNFGSAVVTSRAVDVSGLSSAELVNADIEGTDPRNAFAVGDIIHATDDIIVGEISAMADANTITFRADG